MSGGVFICYRREDSAGFAGRIYDRLVASLGRESVFIDVDGIPAGRDFVEVLSERVGRCDALIALIGHDWLASKDKDNRRRLDDANDFVRIEIEAALDRNVPVIPVLVDGAAMPSEDDLPAPIKKLARRQGIEIAHSRFDSDAERLTDALARIDGATPGRPAFTAGLLSPTRSPKLSWRWLLLAAAILAIIAGGAGLLALQRGKADAPDARRDLQQWTKVSDFRPDLTSRLNRTPMYPERIEARCENGVSQRRVARWLPLQEGQDFVRYYTPEEDFASFEADQIAKGFKKTFDTFFRDCDGSMDHISGWMKSQ